MKKNIMLLIVFSLFARTAYADWTFFPYPSDKPVENIISSLAVDHDGVVWASSGNDLWTMKNNQWQNYSKEITSLIPNGIRDILIGNDNTKWFASSDYAANPFVFSFDGVAWKQYPFLTYSSVQGVPPFQCPVYMLNKIALDKDNVLWFAGNGGIIQLNPDLSWSVFFQNGNFGNTNLFNHANVNSIAVDSNNVKWFTINHTDSSSINGDLGSYDGISWKLYNQPNVPVTGESIIKVECGIDNSLCIELAPRLQETYLYKNSVWKKLESSFGPNLESPSADKKGGFWLLVYDLFHKPAVQFIGVLRLTDTGTETFFSQNLFNDFFEYKIYVDSNNTKWFVSAHGIWRYDESSSEVSQNVNRPVILSLSNSPNPFNPSTTIAFTLPTLGKTELTIYTVNGQKVRTLISGNQTAGTHSVVWNGRDDNGKVVSSGVYVAKLTDGNFTTMRKMLMMK